MALDQPQVKPLMAAWVVIGPDGRAVPETLSYKDSRCWVLIKQKYGSSRLSIERSGHKCVPVAAFELLP